MIPDSGKISTNTAALNGDCPAGRTRNTSP
jgi:hypothetical protein